MRTIRNPNWQHSTVVYDPSPWQDDEGLGLTGALDDLDVDLSHDFLEGGAKQRALISAIGVELQQERKHAEHCRHDKCATVAILDVGRVHDGVDQQALRIDDNVTLLALDLLASVVPRRIVGPGTGRQSAVSRHL